MKVPKVTSILLVVLVSLTMLNFILKYYTYFVLIVLSSKHSASEVNSIAQETGEVPHPHELFVPLLTFIPSRSPVFLRPWVLITSSFIEENFVGLTMSFMLFFYLGKYLENMWGSKELTKFVFANVIVANVTLYFYYVLKSFVISEQTMEVPPVVISAMAVNMGLFVAIKQRISNHYFIFFKGNLRVKVTFLPFILLVLCFLLLLISEEFYISFLLSFLGFVISWTYLRFFKAGTNDRQSYLLPFALNRKRSSKNKYKLHPTGPENLTVGSSSALGQVPSSASTNLQIDSSYIKGDRSEQFSLYTFFPAPLSFVVKMVSSVVFNTLVHYHFLNSKDFATIDVDDDDNLQMEDVNNLQTTLFDLSPLKGAENVSAIPHAGSSIKKVWDWFSSSKSQSTKPFSIKSSMDKRRKLALKELE